MPPVLAVVGAAVGIAGTIYSANQQAKAAKRQAAAQREFEKAQAKEHERVVALNKEIAERNALNLLAQAEWERGIAGEQADALLFQAEREAGRQRAFTKVAAAASRRRNRQVTSTAIHRGAGATGSLTGSGLMLAANTAAELELDSLMVEYSGEVQARRVEEQAALEAHFLVKQADRRGVTLEQEAEDWRFRAKNQPPTPVVSPAPSFESIRTAGYLQAAGQAFTAAARYGEAAGWFAAPPAAAPGFYGPAPI